jgi:hypothetical protein
MGVGVGPRRGAGGVNTHFEAQLFNVGFGNLNCAGDKAAVNLRKKESNDEDISWAYS